MRDITHRYTPYTFKDKLCIHLACLLIVSASVVFSLVCAIVFILIATAAICGVVIIPVVSVFKYTYTVYEAYTCGMPLAHLLQIKYLHHHESSDNYDYRQDV